MTVLGARELTRDSQDDDWRDTAPRGTSYVTDVEVTDSGVVAGLRHPAGYTVVNFDCRPEPEDRGVPRGLSRPLAVHICSHGHRVECTVLGTSSKGPRRVSVTLGQALGLASSGVHTILCTG